MSKLVYNPEYDAQWDELMRGVVRQACHDYMKPKHQEGVVKFLLSNKGRDYCDVANCDPEVLLCKLEKIRAKKAKEKEANEKNLLRY